MPDITMKMGALNSLPTASTNTAGTVYFAKSKTYNGKNYGELHYDDASGARIKIAPSIATLSNYHDNGTLTTKIVLEDGTVFSSAIPLATSTVSGIVSTEAQTFAGSKTFAEDTTIQKKLIVAHTIAMQRSTNNYILIPTGASFYVSIGDSVSIENSPLAVNGSAIIGGKKDTYDIGTTSNHWNNIYVNTVNTTTIDANTITANRFTGPLTGNASTATTLQTGRNINGTLFDGSKDITTNSWGTSRTISINSKAGTTGTSVDGSGNATLVIPSTMTDFVSITSTTFLGTNVGSTSSHITSARINDLYVYNSNSSGYTQLKRDETGTTNRTLNLPAASGRLTYIGSAAVGGTGQPVYAAATGAITACTSVSVAYGGTGKTSLDSGKALIGAGTGAVTLRSITDNTTKTAVTASTNLITANTLYHHSGNSNLTTVGTISSGTWNGTTIAVGYGGTGTATAPKAGGIIYGSSTTAYACSNAGTSGYLLQSGGTGAPSWIQATNANTASTIVKRNSSGDFSAGTITASLSGNATTASTLLTPRSIDGITFDGGSDIAHYAICNTEAATAAKVVTCSGFTLVTGAKISVKFTYKNTADNPTLKVGSTDAKAIYYGNSAISASYLNSAGGAGSVVTFVYDGTNYQVVGGVNTVSYYMTQYTTTTDANYPLLFKYNTATANISSYGRFNANIYANPGVGSITAPLFVTTNYGTADPNTSGATTAAGTAIKGAGTNGALYFQIVTS